MPSCITGCHQGGWQHCSSSLSVSAAHSQSADQLLSSTMLLGASLLAGTGSARSPPISMASAPWTLCWTTTRCPTPTAREWHSILCQCASWPGGECSEAGHASPEHRLWWLHPRLDRVLLQSRGAFSCSSGCCSTSSCSRCGQSERQGTARRLRRPPPLTCKVSAAGHPFLSWCT